MGRRKTHQNVIASRIEHLEHRRLLSGASALPQALYPADNNTVSGTSGNDQIIIRRDTNGWADDAWVNTPTNGIPTQLLLTSITIGINAGAGTDTLILDSSLGNPLPTGPSNPVLILYSGPGSFLLSGRLPTIDADHVVDLTTSTVIIPYTGATPLAAVQSELANGFLESIDVAATHGLFGIAAADSGSQITLRPAVIGDTNEDGSVDFADLLALAQHYGTSGADWSQGDFNNDGSVSFTDLLSLAQHYGRSRFPAPSNLNVVRCSDGEATITWQDNTTPIDPATGFLIEYSADGGATWQTGGTAPPGSASFNVPYPSIFFDPTKTYRFRVSALGSGNQEATSAPSISTFMEPISYPEFSANTGFLQRNGNGSLNTGSGGNPANALEITSDQPNQTTSVFTKNRYDISVLDTTFDFEFNRLARSPQGEGFTFTAQAAGATQLGTGGEQLGYRGIPRSIAIEFGVSESDSTTGLYTDGEPITDAPATAPGQIHASYSMAASGIDFHRNFNDVFRAHLHYDGTNLTETIVDLTTNAVFTMSWAINIPQVLGNKCAFIGFTGATDSNTAQQDIIDWTENPTPYLPVAAADPASTISVLLRKNARRRG